MQLYDIFVQAINLPEKDRKVFIQNASNGDQAVIDEVNELLQNDSDNTNNWSNFLSDQAANLNQQNIDYSGQLLGPYILKHELGSGGMGAVYLGERVNGSFEQQVAIKIINPLLESIIGANNLIREANFMAKLNHSAIGKVFDSGLTESGSHYIVMELVEGEPISTLWANKSTNFNSKLNIFTDLCDAVHHAHQRQVIHADIKPSNIMVNSTGQLKILDFGISRMFNVDNQDAHTAYKFYVRALTAKYASPEVKCGELPSVYSDIYSLGRVLEDLLEHKDNPKQLAELNAIIEKATAVEYQNRYASVLELRQDITRFLRHDVVEAYSATKWFKAKKFVTNKHPVASIFASATFITIIYLTTNLAIQNHNITLAKQESDLTVKKLSQLLEMADLKKTNGKELYAKDLLNNAKRLILEETNLNADSIAKIKYSLANSFESLGELNEANTLLLDIINNVGALVDKDLAYKAGEKYVLQLLYSNGFDKIQADTRILVEYLTFSNMADLPDSLPQAKFYHQYLNGVKYHLYQSRPSEMGAKHVVLLRNMKKHYWDKLDNDTRGSISGALAGALLNQIHNGIEFSFEQIIQSEFDTLSRPLIEEAIAAVEESIRWYEQQNNQIAIIQKKMVLGRALIEIDRFNEGRLHMESALNSLQGIIGKEHPNNIQFYRIMAGFYAYDEPITSLEYAKKSATLAKNNNQVQPVQYLHALDAQLFALNNTGDFEQYKLVADELFQFYLSIKTAFRTVDTLHIAAKTLDTYNYLFNHSPKKLVTINSLIKEDYQRFISNNDNAPARVVRLIDEPFLQYVDSLSQDKPIMNARMTYLEKSIARTNQTPRDHFFSKKQKLELAFLQIQQENPQSSNQIKQLPHFPWNNKELKQSSHIIDIRLKKAFIYNKQGKHNQAQTLLTDIEQQLHQKSLPFNNGWEKRLTELKATI